MFAEGYTYNPFQDEEGTYCQDGNPSCIIVQDDFLQYYLGAYRYVGGAGLDPADDSIFPVEGTAGPFDPLYLTFNGPDSAQNGDFASTLLVTSSVLDPGRVPAVRRLGRGGTVGPSVRRRRSTHDGDWFMSAGAHDAAYKRLLKPFSVPAGGGNVRTSATSFDLEADYDYIFVEIHTVGAGRLDHARRRERPHLQTTSASPVPSTGDGSDWQSNHPFLAHYQTKIDGGDDCDPTGSSGSWNAATGNSGGWQEWSMPIPAAYNGENVEISVSVVSDPAVQGLGAWVDEMRLVDSGGSPINSADPSFESGHGRLDHCPARPRPQAPAASRTRPAGSGRRAHRSSRRRSRPPTTPSTRASASKPSPAPRTAPR